jgi:hypothetical protein
MLKTKQKRFDKSLHLHLLGIIAWSLVLLMVLHHPTPVSAESSFIQSYNTTSSLQQGMIVQLQKTNANTVEPATQTNIYNTFGVVVNMANASIALEQNSKSNNQVFVANSGHYNILVSDQNGPIEAGDYITLSPIDGVGMKDNSTEPIVVAQALSSFDGSGPILGTDQLKTSTGTEKVHLSLVQASISIGHNPLLASSSTIVPKALEQLSKTVTGKSVAAWRIWLAVAILLVVAFIVGVMLYGAARSSLISIGRNPLSKKAITKGFIEVVTSALIIFISAVFGVYLLLKV